MPGVVLRTTILTGFPGETEEDFEELCDFIKDIRFERLGCFAFSSEEGTPAASLPGQIPDEVKNRRRDIVMQTQERIADEYNQAQVGKTLEVLVESFDKYAECWFGRSTADAPTSTAKSFSRPRRGWFPGDLIRVQITDCLDWTCLENGCKRLLPDYDKEKAWYFHETCRICRPWRALFWRLCF